jgi:hypothetical protein
MLGRNSGGVRPRNAVPIGEAIANGAGLYANEIQNARDAMEMEYGNVISKTKLSIADLGGGALGASDGRTVYMSDEYVKNNNMTKAMKDAEKSGFHPKIGDKTGAEAVTAHELGHFLSKQATDKSGLTERQIVERAGKKVGIKVNHMASHISGYARYNYSETIAEASADVYCNGRRASKASRAIMSEIKSILR